MPVSTSAHISHCLSRIIELQPGSVLDVGCGFGLWGFLCREYVDVWNGRVQPQEWTTRIDGIELFAPYIQAHHRALYSSIRIADIREAVATLDDYDLIIAGDVIEHLEKAEGEAVIEALYGHARRALLVNIPLGSGWDHPEQYGNPGELHRSQWDVKDFLAYPHELQPFQMMCGAYGSFYCSKDIPTIRRVESLRAAAEWKESSGDLPGAVHCLQQAHALIPGDETTAVFLTDLLLRQGAVNDAVTLLQSVLAVNAAYHYGRYTLVRLLLALQRNVEAQTELELLLTQPGVPQELAAKARELRSG